MDEIVVALRETRQRAGRPPPVVDAVTDSGAPDIATLRTGEIDRLLAENARLNERVVYLLKVIEREQTRSAGLATDRATIEREVRGELEAELRPILRILLRLAERHGVGGEAADANWIVDLDAQHG